MEKAQSLKPRKSGGASSQREGKQDQTQSPGASPSTLGHQPTASKSVIEDWRTFLEASRANGSEDSLGRNSSANESNGGAAVAAKQPLTTPKDLEGWL